MRLTLPVPTPVRDAPDRRRADATTGPVAEVATFRILPGTDAAAFLAAARGTEAAVAARPGFRARHLGRDEAGLWTDVVEWESLADAQAAAAAVMADPGFGPFAALIDMETLTMRHSAILFRMG